jgi:hypothetical protein
MRKITWSVAALLIAGTTLFGQTSDNNDDKYDKAMKELKALEYQIEEIVDALRMDMYYGHIQREKGNYYIREVMHVKHTQRQITADLWKQRQITLGEHYTNLSKYE